MNVGKCFLNETVQIRARISYFQLNEYVLQPLFMRLVVNVRNVQYQHFYFALFSELIAVGTYLCQTHFVNEVS